VAFTVFMYVVGGYATVLLAAMLYLEKVREPVPQSAAHPHAGAHGRLHAWPRTGRRCAVAHESALPLRCARLSSPARRQRPAPTSCRR
jgi:hypothetical protein